MAGSRSSPSSLVAHGKVLVLAQDNLTAVDVHVLGPESVELVKINIEGLMVAMAHPVDL